MYSSYRRYINGLICFKDYLFEAGKDTYRIFNSKYLQKGSRIPSQDVYDIKECCEIRQYELSYLVKVCDCLYEQRWNWFISTGNEEYREIFSYYAYVISLYSRLLSGNIPQSLCLERIERLSYSEYRKQIDSLDSFCRKCSSPFFSYINGISLMVSHIQSLIYDLYYEPSPYSSYTQKSPQLAKRINYLIDAHNSEIELRFNECHDPQNGRFCSKNGSYTVSPKKVRKENDALKEKQRKRELKENNTYSRNGITYETGENGEILSVSGKIRPEDLNPDPTRIGYDSTKAGGKDRRDTDEGGHIIAHALGGSDELDNLVPMDKNLNHSAWSKIEKRWHKLLNDPDVESVDVDIEMSYDDPTTPKRPTGFSVKYTVSRKKGSKAIAIPIKLDNEPGQTVEIKEIEL